MAKFSGVDPTRRNRNIGTSRQGHGDNNRDRVPDCWKSSNSRWRRVAGAVVVDRLVWGCPLSIMVEPTYDDHLHACTPDDIARVLNALPQEHIRTHEGIQGFAGVLLRQPTRKEQQLNPVWGRIHYGMEVGNLIGPVIQIPAQPCPSSFRWHNHLAPDYQEELARLQAAASSSQFDGRSHHFEFDLEAVRRYQLFHSLPHEVGHWVDMLEKVEYPAARDQGASWDSLWDRFWQRPSAEREAFAHRYAENAVKYLKSSGEVPFMRMIRVGDLESEGLTPKDFM